LGMEGNSCPIVAERITKRNGAGLLVMIFRTKETERSDGSSKRETAPCRLEWIYAFNELSPKNKRHPEVGCGFTTFVILAGCLLV
jgi:hypothetical protein